MRNTIEGFNQPYLLKLNLGPNDAVILRWLLSFIHSRKQISITHEDEEYFWVKYSKVISDLPCLYITQEAYVGALLKKLCGIGKPNENEYPLAKYTQRDGLTNKTFFRFRPDVLEAMQSYPDSIPTILSSPEPVKLKDIEKKKVKLHPNVTEIIQDLKKIKCIDGLLFKNKLPIDDCHYTKSISHFRDMLFTLYEGRFLNSYKNGIAKWFLEKYKYYISDESIEKIKACKGSWKRIKELMIESATRYAKWFEPNKEINDKDKLPRDFAGFIFNSHTETSMFYACLIKDPTRIRETHAEETYEKLPSTVTKVFAPMQKDHDGFSFWTRVGSVYKWWKKYVNELTKADSNCQWFMGDCAGFLAEYKDWLNEFTSNAPSINNLGTDNKTFALFLSKAKKEHEISINLPKK